MGVGERKPEQEGLGRGAGAGRARLEWSLAGWRGRRVLAKSAPEVAGKKD